MFRVYFCCCCHQTSRWSLVVQYSPCTSGGRLWPAVLWQLLCSWSLASPPSVWPPQPLQTHFSLTPHHSSNKKGLRGCALLFTFFFFFKVTLILSYSSFFPHRRFTQLCKIHLFWNPFIKNRMTKIEGLLRVNWVEMYNKRGNFPKSELFGVTERTFKLLCLAFVFDKRHDFNKTETWWKKIHTHSW